MSDQVTSREHATSSRDIHRSNVTLPREWDRAARIPLWTDSGIEALLHAGSSSRLSAFHEHAAVILRPEETRLETCEGKPVVNHHFLRAGHPRLMAVAWCDAWIEIGRVYGFSKEHDWGCQREGVKRLFEEFFGSQVVRGHFGWISLITAQRPQHLRSWEDSRITVTTDEIHLGTSRSLEGEMLLAGMHRCPANRFLFLCRGREKNHVLRSSTLLRRFSAPAWLARDRRLTEWRFVPAIPSEHDPFLVAGRIPSLHRQYERQYVLGTTGYFNLVLLSLNNHGRCVLLQNTLEIDPDSGRIVSMRGFETAVELAVLGASVVEHVALCQVVNDLTGGSRL